MTITVREFLFKDFTGCSNHACIVKGKRKGMGTNGRCSCLVSLSRTQLAILDSRLRAINILDNIVVSGHGKESVYVVSVSTGEYEPYIVHRVFGNEQLAEEYSNSIVLHDETLTTLIEKFEVMV